MGERTALVVGGTSGIGLETARQLRARGAAVHVAGRSKERLEALAVSDPELIGHRADGGDRGQIAEVLSTIGTLDWLVVSLSGAEGAGPFAELDLDALRGAFEAKFWGQLTTVQAALPHLSEDGSITLVTAISARTGMPGTAGLAAVNGALEAMIRPLARELAPRRINAVSPGLVDTPWWNGLPQDARDAYFAQAAAQLPTRRIASPADVAEAVVLAATNRNLTGTVLESDGGLHLAPLN
ncbi:SDR family oxidoreductase [Kitasatospora cineracea]|uniref:NAD(P)-dependent dehydrogenase (Short-subunit alcohol dehydrogenase family) n=1 Tax=Kitasatospora cineracea TaxID=88074 RepID=A0A3N4RM67_9ACTN|nr:SDR family oxidoreductase [Kitasatospora cineracea]RPE31911.1 NAD(P)-dependent dehydrogenase (short-subunit alcohol dehydrogenase family) [Kitasatospora cineracea]